MSVDVASSESELSLDSQIVRQLLAAQFPVLKDAAIEFVRQGWDNSAWLVDGQWNFRFPRRLERQVWLESEIAALGLLAGRTLPIDIPKPAFLGRPGPLYPCGFVGYRRIDGTPGDQLDVRAIDRGSSAQRLGEALTQLHSIDVARAAADGVPPYELTAQEALEEVVAMRETVLPALPEDLVPACAPFLNGDCELPAQNVRRALIHSDLVDEHILIDGAGRVTGLIDWGDACIGNPALDFGGLFAWLGADFVDSVLARYAPNRNPAFAEEIAFFGRCAALVVFGYSLQGRDTSSADRRQLVRTAFAEGM